MAATATVFCGAETLTLTSTTGLDAPRGRAWRLWADPRRLERWWGPPTYPATFVDHDLTPGGRCTYFMSGPEGDRPPGWWLVRSTDEPVSLEIESGFSHEDDSPDSSDPVARLRVTFDAPPGDRTRTVITARYESAAALEQIVAMGMIEGMSQASRQIAGLLADG